MPRENELDTDSGFTSDEEEDQLSDEEYSLQNVLRPPRVVTYSIEKLYALMHCGDLDLEPEYQRGFVWTEPKQMAIIDSLLRNYYIPPVIFHVSYGESGEEKRVAIDGKQRLTSIQRFIDGLIPHRDSATGTRYYSAKAADLHPGKKLNILPTTLENKFYMKQITCVEYDSLTETQEREIFHRVQLGMPLTAAERMSAIPSQRAQAVHMLEKVLASWPANVKLADDRKRRFQVIGHFVRCISHLDSTGKMIMPSNPALEKWLRETGPVGNMDSMKEDLEILTRLAKEYPDIAFSSSIAGRLAPIEFIFTALLVHKFRHRMGAEQLALAIKAMRLEARANHIDIRTNSRVAKTFEDFIDGIPAKLAKGAYGHGESASSKRKRADAYGDDDEYVGSTAAMDISGEERKRVTRRKRGTELSSVKTPRKDSSDIRMKSSPPASGNLFSPGPSDSSTSREASNPAANSTPMRSNFLLSYLPGGGIGPFGSKP